ncbi:MAG: DUF547 domain-containing protein [Ginsengibacter sp.]
MRIFLFAIFFGSLLTANAQDGYKTHNTISNFKTERILNYSSEKSDFNSLKKQITIIDFFGTWCIPCLRALPHLDSLQKQFPNTVRIMLVSVEKENVLQKFVDDHKARNFPLVVDEGNKISDLFQPPSYPYTVVINSANNILAITEASSLNADQISGWLEIKSNAISEVVPSKKDTSTFVKNTQSAPVNKDNELSQQFIYAAKTGNDVSGQINELAKLNLASLATTLSNDDMRKAFWINLYNGFTQYFLKKDPERYKSRGKFFKAKQINVAGTDWSLDQIEHDILRRSKVKWSLGYLNKIIVSKKIKMLRLDHLDYRIHFALNCGAKSCPPIAFYDPNHINQQLDVATRAYLTGEADYNSTKNTLELPAIMGWFRRDFKGKKNMLKLVKKLDIVPEDKYPRISFKKYDWNLYLNNYKQNQNG